MANKSGFEIGDRIIIHDFKEPNCCEGKTGTIIKLYYAHEGRYVAKLDDGYGCCDINGVQNRGLPHDCIVVQYMKNAQLIDDSKPIDIEELI